MRINAVDSNLSKFHRQSFKENEVATKPKEVKPEIKTSDKSKVLPIASAALAAVSLGVAIYATKGKNKNNTKFQQEIKNETEKIVNKAKEDISAKADDTIKIIRDKVDIVEDKVIKNSDKITEKHEWSKGYLDELDVKVKDLQARPTQINSGLTMDRNWTFAQDGMRLRINTDNGGDRKVLKETIIEKLNTSANKFITGKDAKGIGPAVAVLGANASIWLPSAETKPEKEGGLGEVPVQMATNYVKEYGIKEVYIPRPLIEIPGKSWIKQIENKWVYWYQGLKNDKGEDITMDVKKVAEYETVAYHNGFPNREKVEVFYGVDPVGGYKRLMFRNPNYFASDGLYAGSDTAEEPERYTFFNAALYDFIKLLKDPNSTTFAKTQHPQTLEAIKAPDAMALNDWHVAPLAALFRNMAPVEAQDKKLKPDVAQQLENMNLLYIVHNADYQGSVYGAHRDDILNTLFKQYTYDIVEHARTGFTEKYVEDSKEYEKPISALKSPFIIDNNVNMANMAMAYANKVKPVSFTYSKELAEQGARSMGLQHISAARLKAGTMVGQSNGWDRSVNEVSQANLAGFNNKVNDDKFIIFKHTIDNIQGLDPIEKAKVNNIFKEYNQLNMNNFEEVYARLDRLNIPVLDATLKELKEAGVTELRKFQRATCDMPEEELFAARKNNKRMLFEYLKSMIEYDKTHEKQLFCIKELHSTDLSNIDPEKLDEVPFFNMGVRFVEQKGVDIVSKAWTEILSNWDALYPGKARPVVIIGGVDPTAKEVYKNMLKDAKTKLNFAGNTLIQWDGFTPNNILMAGSDITMRPSHFEPDGDKWESLYKGTPMVMTKVGGHIDSITDGFNGFLTSRTVPELEEAAKESIAKKPLTKGETFNDRVLVEKVKDYVEALKKSLDAFYDGNKQKELVLNSINGNQSWVIKDKEGKILECPSLLHLKDLGFDLSQFPQIAESVYKK